MQMLLQHTWPENIDELARVIKAAAGAAKGRAIGASHLPAELRHAILANQFGRPAEVKIRLLDYLSEIEKRLIERALAQAKGNKTRSAQMLGINRARLLRRMQQLGIETDSIESDGPREKQIDSSAFEEAD
jgi:DNA-binding NtrC family response regulator